MEIAMIDLPGRPVALLRNLDSTLGGRLKEVRHGTFHRWGRGRLLPFPEMPIRDVAFVELADGTMECWAPDRVRFLDTTTKKKKERLAEEPGPVVAAAMTAAVAVPIEKLRKLEEARIALYNYLGDYLTEVQMVQLSGFTGPIWEVANTRDWRLKRPAFDARPLSEWHEDIGAVSWWVFPINEPPYCGTPLDDNWPGCHTHWTPLNIPERIANEQP